MLTDGQTDRLRGGRREKWMPMSHPATSRCDENNKKNKNTAGGSFAPASVINELKIHVKKKTQCHWTEICRLWSQNDTSV